MGEKGKGWENGEGPGVATEEEMEGEATSLGTSCAEAEEEFTLDCLPRHLLVRHVMPRLPVAGVCALGTTCRRLREVAGQNDFWRTEYVDRLSREFKPGRVPVKWQRCMVTLVDHLASRRVLTEKLRFACLRAAHLRAFRYSGLQAAVEAGDIPGVVGHVLARCHRDVEAEGRGLLADGDVDQAVATPSHEASRSGFLGWRRSSQVAPESIPPPPAPAAQKGFPSGKGAFRSNQRVAAAAANGSSVHCVLLAEILGHTKREVNRFTEAGASPLATAVRSADATMARLLLALGADPDVTPGAGNLSARSEALALVHNDLDPSPRRLAVLAAFPRERGPLGASVQTRLPAPSTGWSCYVHIASWSA